MNHSGTTKGNNEYVRHSLNTSGFSINNLIQSAAFFTDQTQYLRSTILPLWQIQKSCYLLFYLLQFPVRQISPFRTTGPDADTAACTPANHDLCLQEIRSPIFSGSHSDGFIGAVFITLPAPYTFLQYDLC